MSDSDSRMIECAVEYVRANMSAYGQGISAALAEAACKYELTRDQMTEVERILAMRELTQDEIDRNSHIPDSEVEQDIRDTLAEIETMRREMEGFRLLRDRLSAMRALARETGIREREAFVAKLRALLAARRAIVEGRADD